MDNLLTKKRTWFFSSAFIFIGVVMISFGMMHEKSVGRTPENDEEEQEALSSNCGGVERWDVKTLTDAAASTVNFTPVNATVTYLDNISTPTPNANMPRYAGVEDITYSTTCTITIKKTESDSDYHLVLSDGVNTIISEVVDPYCTVAATSSHQAQFISAWNWVNAHIPQANNYNVNLPQVVVTGVAFVDPPHNQTGAAPNNLELHPVLDIHFANPTGLSVDPSLFLSVSATPDPFNSFTTINITAQKNIGNCLFGIYDMRGALAREITVSCTSGINSFTLQKGDLSPGIYITRLRNSSGLLYEGKIVVQ